MIIRFFCWLFGECYHDWAKWEEVEIEINYPSMPNKPSGLVRAQKRCCKKCGYIQRQQLSKLTPHY